MDMKDCKAGSRFDEISLATVEFASQMDLYVRL